MLNDLLFNVFNTGTLDGFKGTVNRWLLFRLCFLQFPVAQVLVGLRKQFMNNFFPTWAGAAGFDYNNNDNNNNNMVRMQCIKHVYNIRAHTSCYTLRNVCIVCQCKLSKFCIIWCGYKLVKLVQYVP